MAHIKINDISMYYEVHGQGEPIVFIGGFSADHVVWSAVVDHFKEHYQVILFDNRGAGQTDVPDGPYSIDQMAHDVAELCAALKIKKAHFVGNSMGGCITQTLAYRYPDLVKSATISHSAPTINIPFSIFVQAQLELLKAQVPQESLLKILCSWYFSFQFLAQPGMLELLVQLGLNNPHPFTIKGYEGQQAALAQFDSRNWLEHIHVPTLVLGSDQDLVFNEALTKSLAEKIPGAQYYRFTECGHIPQIEYPALYAQIIHEFIREFT